MNDSAANMHGEVLRLLQAGDPQAADDACRRLNARYPTFIAGWFAACHVAMALGRRQDALDAADALERCAGADGAAWDALGTLRSYMNDQRGALAAYDRAVALAPRDSRFLYNRGSVRRFVGDLTGAESDYDQVIALAPMEREAYLNRSELRVQTAARNHVQQLESVLAQCGADWRGEVQLRYALAKEYEDLGEYAKSFAHLRSGARRRREHMKYDVAADVATVDWIMEAFPAGSGSLAEHAAEDAPVFIVGLPRSGSTLVDRIVGSHSLASSAGELDCFALSIVDAVRRRCAQTRIARRDLVAGSASLDFAAVGRDYLRRARAAFGGSGRFIDKMPLNYLYCGLIHRALPNAKIVHVHRHPMAVGYAMYQTLFKDGYPFSYDLNEIGRYYAAYRRLMEHWHATMPGVIHDVSYEDLVADQRRVTARLLEYCGLDWEEGCMNFHENPQAVTTASAAQVRRPVYRSSISRWRHYEQELTELEAQVASADSTVR